jgi:hypothetical protein
MFGMLLAPDERERNTTYAVSQKEVSSYAGLSAAEIKSLENQLVWIGKYKHASKLKAKGQKSAYTEPAVAYEKSMKPILWHIMGSEGSNKVQTLVSEYVIDSKPFNSISSSKSFDYTKSSLRKWLNGAFLKKSLSAVESKSLKKNNVVQKMYDEKKKKWVKGKFTTYWDKTTTKFPKTAKGDKVYISWNLKNSPSGNEMGWPCYWDFKNTTSVWNKRGILKGSLKDVRNDYDNEIFKAVPYKYALFTKKTIKERFRDSVWIRDPTKEYIKAEAKYYDMLRAKAVSGTLRNGYSKFINEMSRSPWPYASDHIRPGNNSSSSYGIRPIIRLDTKKVLSFSSKTVSGKTGLKLTLISSAVKLDSLSYAGGKLKDGATITITANDKLKLTGKGKGHDTLAYKILSATPSKGVVISSGKGTKKGLEINAISLEAGSYKLYVWAQKNHGGYSNEGSTPKLINLSVV